MTLRPLFALAAATLALSACAGSPDAQVTRFHLGQPIARATIFIAPQAPGTGGTLEFQTNADALAGQLHAQGFAPVATAAQAELIGLLDVSRGYRSGGSRGPQFSIGLGGGTFGRHTAIGGGVNIPVGKARPNDIAVTTVALQIKRRSDGSIIWEGRAVGEARESSPESSLSVAVPRLAGALLAGFPGQSGQTVRVKL